LKKPNRENIREYVADFWDTSPERLKNKSAFITARDFMLFSIWGCIRPLSLGPLHYGPSPLENLKRNVLSA
jgi:hypothetical protein